jgi:hypothetical protein
MDVYVCEHARLYLHPVPYPLYSLHSDRNQEPLLLEECKGQSHIVCEPDRELKCHVVTIYQPGAGYPIPIQRSTCIRHTYKRKQWFDHCAGLSTE